VLALLFDVHGNLPALEAVLADVRAQGHSDVVLGGDYALFGGWPGETVMALREIDGATWIRGNGERWTAAPGDAPDNEVVQGAIAACREALGEWTVTELAALPFDVVLDGTRICHASPRSDVESFLPEPAANEAELLADVHEPRLVFGHTHLAFVRQSPVGVGIELVNPGSVGMPFDGDPRAAWALLHDDGSVEHRRVAYDHESSARRVRERFGGAPWTEVVAARIEHARFEPAA
jgi:diadenosine tetraphosphatase ApaH/serine/threonine PP2A family protein phosphatase